MRGFDKLCFLMLAIILLVGCTIQGCQNSVDKDVSRQSLIQEQDVLIVQSNSYGLLDELTSRIQLRTLADVYYVEDDKTISLDEYDIILIGDTPINDQPTDEVVSFLQQYDLDNKKVSMFWVGAMDNQIYETNTKQYIKSQKIINGLGFNSDEISEESLIGYFINEWITSIYYTI